MARWQALPWATRAGIVALAVSLALPWAFRFYAAWWALAFRSGLCDTFAPIR